MLRYNNNYQLHNFILKRIIKEKDSQNNSHITMVEATIYTDLKFNQKILK